MGWPIRQLTPLHLSQDRQAIEADMLSFMKGTSSSLQMPLGTWAGGDHAQPDPALRLCPGLPAALSEHMPLSICQEPKVALTWAESLAPPETTGKQAAGTISRGQGRRGSLGRGLVWGQWPLSSAAKEARVLLPEEGRAWGG